MDTLRTGLSNVCSIFCGSPVVLVQGCDITRLLLGITLEVLEGKLVVEATGKSCVLYNTRVNTEGKAPTILTVLFSRK